ncbi:carbohydrate ABC transporter permease [Gynuella sunshinyii]|uniref:ABC-type sugar transport system, permease component n=1 Tax=Gynuella sunshinyii YC6258 TaxID=1445510 RepID=A0A0C5VL59_9GAMM|nr:sugar ABC transporter permease [Gynuella sunshinyii]AJQ95046.1 ABC-type sugar transport system, permease component [Gynuella sunshinyii YC6258]
MKALIHKVAEGLDRLMRMIEAPTLVLQKKIGIHRMGYVFLAPNMVLFSLFVFLPVGLAIAYAFTGGTNMLIWDRPYVGLENFSRLLNCKNYMEPATCEFDLFWTAIHNTWWYTLLNSIGTLLMALITALVLNRLVRGKAFFRAVFFYPVLLSPVVVGLIWKWFLARNGLLNGFIENLGGERIIFLLEVFWSRFWVVYISIWFHMGFFTLIILAGLQAIPSDIYEAAQVDGTSRWRQFWRLTLPLLMPNLLVVAVLLLIRSVQVFDEAWVLTDGGGPGTANTFIVQFIYQTAFNSEVRLYGLASAASVLMGLVLLILTLAQVWLAKKSEY